MLTRACSCIDKLEFGEAKFQFTGEIQLDMSHVLM